MTRTARPALPGHSWIPTATANQYGSAPPPCHSWSVGDRDNPQPTRYRASAADHAAWLRSREYRSACLSERRPHHAVDKDESSTARSSCDPSPPPSAAAPRKYLNRERWSKWPSSRPESRPGLSAWDRMFHAAGETRTETPECTTSPCPMTVRLPLRSGPPAIDSSPRG